MKKNIYTQGTEHEKKDDGKSKREEINNKFSF